MTPLFPPLQQQGQGSAPPKQVAQFRSDGITAVSGLRIPFFSESFSRAFGLPETRLENMLSEATPLREERPYVPLVGLREIRYSRPGLVSYQTNGPGPIRGIFVPQGTSDLFVVSGTQLWVNGGNVGTIPGTDMVRFAASPTQIVILASGVAWLYIRGGYPLAQIAGLPPVIDVAWLAQYFVFACQASQVFYFSAVNDASTIPGLNFESAELAPDSLVGLGVLNDELVAFKTNSVEFFSLSADANAPFLPIAGRGFSRGCVARQTIAFADNALYWLGDNGVVYRSKDAPERISSNAMEDRIRQLAAGQGLARATAFTATFEGHELYVLNLPGVGSYAYDVSRQGTTVSTYGDSFARGEWDAWTSFGRPQFRGCCSANRQGLILVGDDQTNDVGLMQVGTFTDYGDPLVRVASAFIKIEEGNPRCDSLVLHCVMGVGNAAGAGKSPVVEMRYSDDQGRTFGKWRQAPLGKQGAYRHPRAEWRRLGVMRAPGRLVEVRCSDPVDFAVSHLELSPSRPAW